MGISERKVREREEMRERILKVAADLFIREGYERTTIRALADRIEYSPATIYIYFKDKDEIFQSLFEEGFTRLTEVILEAGQIADPLDSLKEMVRAHVKFAKTYPEFYDLMFIMRISTPIFNTDLDPDSFSGKCIGHFIGKIKECSAAGLLRIQDPTIAAIEIWSFFHGLCALHIRGRLGVLHQSETVLEGLMNEGLESYLLTIGT